MKKICFVITVATTVKEFALPFIRYLSRNTDWQITVICAEDKTLSQVLPEGVRYIPVSMKRGVSPDALAAMKKLWRIFKEERFDIVQYSTPNAAMYASTAARFAGIPVRLYCQWGMAYVGFTGFKRWLFKNLEKQICRNSTRIEPDSFSNLAFGRQEGIFPAHKSGVVGNGSAIGVDLKKFDIARKEQWRHQIREKHGICEDAVVYIFAGRITRDKGINELLEAFRAMRAAGADAYLLMLGYIDKPESLDKNLLDWAQQEKNVIFTGYTDQVPQYVAAADVHVLPSYREGFGCVIIEAEAMGVPVIATNIPGPVDAMRDGEMGVLIPVKDAAALRSAMERLGGDVALREKMGSAGHEFVKTHFEQEQLMEKMRLDRLALMGE